MKSEDWALIQDLFEAGLDLDDAARGRLLREKLGAQPELQAELIALWAADTGDDPFEGLRLLTRQVTAGGTSPAPADFAQLEILEQIGRGGMGVVYKVRQKQLNRVLALKVLPLGFCDPQRLLRFQGEQRALALIDHPNVARVYECGETPEGQPYYTMDYLEGSPITHWCDEHRLDLAQRLALVRGLCDGLAQVHGKGIIHRDINPNNVIVSPGPDGPVARVIDFGIAKFADRGLQTKTGAVLGTPGYMSPEQMAGGGEAEVDVRSDIFNLGALIYELCLGCSPWGSRIEEATSLQALIETTRRYPPIPPTKALRILGPTLAQVADRRATTAAELSTRVAGELSWIVMKALDLDPRQRYQDCRSLIRDLDNYRLGLPLEAAPVDRLYRWRKLARYYRRPLLLAAGFVALLLVAMAAVSVAFVRTRAAESETRAALARAQAVQAFTLGIFAEVDPSRSGGAVTGVALLEQAERKVSQDYADKPELEAATRMVLGEAWRGLGQWERADQQFMRAYALNRQRLGGEAEDSLRALEAAAYTAFSLGRQRTALARFEDCARGYRARLGADAAERLRVASGKALVLRELGLMAEAETLFRETLTRQERARVDDAQIRATRQNFLEVLIARGQLTEAEALQAKIAAQAKGSADPAYALEVAHNQCYLLEKTGAREAAAQGYANVLQRREALLGKFHPDSLLTRNNLAVCLGDTGKVDEALALLTEVLDDPQRPQSGHWIFPRLQHNLGHYLMTAGRLAEAEPVLAAVLQERSATLGAAHPQTLRTQWTLAETWLAAGERAKALQGFSAVATTAAQALGANHPDTQLYQRLVAAQAQATDPR